MLKIKRKTGQSFSIGGNVFVHVTKTGRNVVELSIDAPRDIEIVRTEVIAKEADHAKVGNTMDTVDNREGLPRGAGVSQAES